MGNELQQPTAPEPITICVTNYSSCNLVILGRQSCKIDGVLMIEVFVGSPGQNLRLVKDGKTVEDSEDMLTDEPKPVA